MSIVQDLGARGTRYEGFVVSARNGVIHHVVLKDLLGKMTCRKCENIVTPDPHDPALLLHSA